MNIAEQYEFDLKGYVIFKNVLSSEEVAFLLDVLSDVNGASQTGKFSFFNKHPFFAELMVRPRTVEAVRNLCGDWVRFDHAIGLRMQKGAQQRQGLHGGNGTSQGAFFYQFHHNRMYNGLVKALYSLTEVKEGDGGFVCIPGSHKANIDYTPESTASPLVINPPMQAGDLLVFTEALVHGSRPWQGQAERFALVYSYAPGCLAWKDPATLDHYYSHITTQEQKDMMRPPYVGQYDETAQPADGSWPRNKRTPTLKEG